MSRFWTIAVLLLACVLSHPVFVSAECTDPVIIPDANLLQAIKSELGVTGDLTCADLANLHVLIANNKGISSVEGIENAWELGVLDLHLNNISSVDGIQYLTGLQQLWLTSNNISDLSPFIGHDLPLLRELHLWDNQITDISPLEHLIDYQFFFGLSLGSNPIQDFSPLSSVRHCNHLYLGETGLTTGDLYFLSNITYINTLDISKNNITDLSPIAYISSWVRTPSLNGNHGTFPESIPFADLEVLWASECDLGNIAFVGDLQHLQVLVVEDNRISNLQPLSNLSELNTVRVKDNLIRSIEAFRDHPGFQNGGILEITRNCVNPDNPNTLEIVADLESRNVSVYNNTQLPHCFRRLPGRIAPPTPMSP